MAKRILVVFGTRPECIKLAPVIAALKARRHDFHVFHVMTCATGQHLEMLDQSIRTFDLTIDRDLAVMQPSQSLAALTAQLIPALSAEINSLSPDWLIVQGDTTTALCAALAAYYAGVPVAHVEAGLRTGDLRNPFPEEANRRLITTLATIHFAPTLRAAEALRREGVAETVIHLTGNTIVDALQWARKRNNSVGGAALLDPDVVALTANGRTSVLVTCHRRESFGADLAAICRGIKRIAQAERSLQIIMPVHLNPNVRTCVLPLLGGESNVTLLEPVSYPDFIHLMSRSALVLTDSGGIQEEAPSLGVPVLVFRHKTERPEAVESGLAQLVGTDEDMIVTAALAELKQGRARVGATNPYGDGKAAERIVDVLAHA
jgi:UDP-N-acetylglucosamine 2-epimerase (non-hydrolysing)